MKIFRKIFAYSTAVLLAAGCISAGFSSDIFNNTVFADDTETVTSNDNETQKATVTVSDLVFEPDTVSGTCSLIDYVGSDKMVSIPEFIEVNGTKLYVSYIEKGFFLKCEGIESIYFPKTIVNLPEDIFGLISSIPKTSMDPENEEYCIIDNILYSKDMRELIGCFNKSLTEYKIPETVLKINKSAFANCMSLKTVSIPASVTDFGNYAFSNCTALNMVTFEEGEEPTAFPSDPTLFENCKFYFYSYKGETGKTLTKYKNYYEDKCHFEDESKTVLTRYIGKDSTFTVPDTVKTIEVAAFTMNNTLTEVILPDSLEKINASAFSKCTGLISVEIPNTVSDIENFAFAECSNLQNVKLPESITSIPTFCFYNCTNLDTIYIPESVSEIGSLAFNCDDFIMTIIYGGTEDQWDDLLDNLKTGNESLLIPDIDVIFEGDKPFLAGDTNLDGCVNAADFTKLTNCILDTDVLSKNQKKNADINGDEKITVADLASLKLILADNGNISEIRIDKPFKD